MKREPIAYAAQQRFKRKFLKRSGAAVLASIVTFQAMAENWPAWRGANGSGICHETDLPLRWGTNQNVRGNSTPIVWEDRIFITQTVQNRRTVICFNKHTGQLIWQAGPTWTTPEQTHPDNPPCTPSPVTDGRRVIAWFGSAGVFCYDLRGRELWRRDLGRQSHMWGYAATPVLDDNLCFVNFGPGARSFLIALNKRTGKTAWQYDVPPYGAGMMWSDLGGQDRAGEPTVSETAGSWATPLIVPAGKKKELVVPFAGRLTAFQPVTGQLLWTCDGPNLGVYSAPFFGEGIVALNASGPTNTLLAVRPGGHGDVNETHLLWIRRPGNNKTCLGAGVIHNGHIYQVNMMGLAECRELQTGRIVWEERLTGTGARNASWSAPVLSGDRLYIPNKNADVFVLRASPRFECMAINSVGGEPMNASLAVSEGEIFHSHRQASLVYREQMSNASMPVPTRGFCAIAILTATLGLSIGAGAQAQTPSRFLQDRFAIGYWVGPQTSENLRDRYREITDANFTLVIGSHGMDIAQQLALCREFGLKAIVDPAGLTLPDHDACWGYALMDEPSAVQFADLARRAEDVRTRRPGKFGYINLFPSYASPAQLGTATYEEHVERFVRDVKPEVLSMDHYPLMRPGADSRDAYLENLATMRTHSLRAAIPFWNFFYSMPFNDRLDPTEAQIRWQIFASIACGAKGVLYFCYWTPGKGAAGAGEFPKGGAIITAEGLKTRHYDEARRINAELKNLGPTLMSLTSLRVLRLKTDTDARPMLAGLPLRNITRVAGDPPGEFVIGIFSHTDGRRAVLILNHDYSFTAWPTLEFASNDPATVMEVSRTTGQIAPAIDDSPELKGLQISFGAGDARLFLLPSP